ncbi:hypothetical protein [Pelagibius sp. Alg239-R121]|uniref:hypothetical protein n=1 Tax=Pelagibius sp. Alg239-R121 TaxID=2993448 RepID=UPI0024A6C967|nr:hypothetical protein [Pelagibius sp. Alg239-R121]
MRCLKTPVLCFLFGLLFVFAVLVNVSAASADDDDHDDRRHAHQSEWHHHGHHKKHHHGKGRKYRGQHWVRHYDDDDHDENCEYEVGRSHRHHKGHGHGGRKHRQYDEYEYQSDERYLDDDQPLDIRPEDTVTWRNPSLPSQEPRQPEVRFDSETSESGPCREYTTTARVGGRLQQIYGHACRQPDGAWKFVQ